MRSVYFANVIAVERTKTHFLVTVSGRNGFRHYQKTLLLPKEAVTEPAKLERATGKKIKVFSGDLGGDRGVSSVIVITKRFHTTVFDRQAQPS